MSIWKKKNKDFWTAAGVIVSAVFSTVALFQSWQNASIAKKQTIPRVIAELRPESVYVGKMQGRIDEAVTIPITIRNLTDTIARDVVVDLLISYDGGKEGVSLNEYFRGINAPVIHRESLGREAWNLPSLAPSVIGNAVELYRSGKVKCKIKIPVEWKDLEGKEYRAICLAELTYKNRIEAYPEQFWWESRGCFDSENSEPMIRKHWGKSFAF